PPGVPGGPLPPRDDTVSSRPLSILTMHAGFEPPPPASFASQCEQFLSDLRAAFRIFRRAPGLSAAAVALMAVGIGGNTAVYSIINAVLNKPAPGVHAENLVNIAATLPEEPNGDVVAFPIFAEFLASTRPAFAARTSRPPSRSPSPSWRTRELTAARATWPAAASS